MSQRIVGKGRRWVRCAMVACALIGGTAAINLAVSDQAMAQAGQKVGVSVMVVQANQSGKVDPKLKAVMAELSFTKFSGARLVEKYDKTLPVNGETTIALKGTERRLKVSVLERTEANAKVRLRLFKESTKKFDTTISIPRGRTAIVGGIKQGENRLLFPVTVNY